VNNFLKISTLLLTGCWPLQHKYAIVVPESNYRVNQNKIRINGYYYSEKSQEGFCRIPPYGTGKLVKKYISAFVLYSDGYVYYPAGLIISGIDMTSFDHCDQLADRNTFEQSRQKFESWISQGSRIFGNGTTDRGVFSLSSDTIRIQVYLTGPNPLQLKEYEGIILNDTTIHLYKEGHYSPKKYNNKKINETYHLKSYASKPDSANYIRDHRNKFGPYRRIQN
jgi:hypothetical protein